MEKHQKSKSEQQQKKIQKKQTKPSIPCSPDWMTLTFYSSCFHSPSARIAAVYSHLWFYEVPGVEPSCTLGTMPAELHSQVQVRHLIGAPFSDSPGEDRWVPRARPDILDAMEVHSFIPQRLDEPSYIPGAMLAAVGLQRTQPPSEKEQGPSQGCFSYPFAHKSF